MCSSDLRCDLVVHRGILLVITLPLLLIEWLLELILLVSWVEEPAVGKCALVSVPALLFSLVYLVGFIVVLDDHGPRSSSVVSGLVAWKYVCLLLYAVSCPVLEVLDFFFCV